MSKFLRLHRLLARQWEQAGWLSNLLVPLSQLTGWYVHHRRSRYASGRLAARKMAVPVIVIGNLYVGGTGKTPVAIAVVQALQARGFTPGVISRGYGVKIGTQARVGQGSLDPARFGDEPALIASRTGAPLAAHPRRALAAQQLLARYPAVDVIVSDDGLQHLALARDIEIVVQDERGLGNGRLLPAGPLREPPGRLDTADAVITNTGHLFGGPDSAGAASGGRPRRTTMTLRPAQAIHINSGRVVSLAELAAKNSGAQVAAAAGIGNPERFFAALRAAGITLAQTLGLPDHYNFTVTPFKHIVAPIILVTSKDAIKCRGLGDDRLWEVPVQAMFSNGEFLDWLTGRVRAAQSR